MACHPLIFVNINGQTIVVVANQSYAGSTLAGASGVVVGSPLAVCDGGNHNSKSLNDIHGGL
jgi:hypothetical protein